MRRPFLTVAACLILSPFRTYALQLSLCNRFYLLEHHEYNYELALTLPDDEVL